MERGSTVEESREQRASGEEQGTPEANGDTTEYAPVAAVLEEWADGTSMHGAAMIANKNDFQGWFRIAWAVITLCSSALMVWQMEALIKDYRSYTVVTDTITTNPHSLQFPEVTMCNTNFFSKTLINETGISEPKTEEEVLQLVYPVDYFITSMRFNNKYLPPQENLTQVITDFGVCYSFQTDAEIFEPGILGGFEFTADLRQDDYVDTDVAGLLVFVTQPGSKITSQVPLIGVTPGKSVMIGLRQKSTSRVREKPWSRCFSEAPQYSQQKCRAECIDIAIRQDCNCRRWGDTNDPGNLTFCGVAGLTTCMDEMNKTAALTNCGQDCSLPPCEHTEYDTSMTTIELSQSLQQQLNELFGTDSRDYFLQNFVSVTVNFEQIQVQEFTEAKAMTRSQLLGAIGGSMGLFLGISALSVFEVLGDLTMLRLAPRLFGYRGLFGLGGRTSGLKDA